MELSTTPDFSSLAFSTDSSIYPQLQVPNLQDNQHYFWRVRANIDGAKPVYSQWSSVWSFTVGISLPNIPKLLSPAKDTVRVSINQALKWNAVDYPDGITYPTLYAVQVSEDTAFTAKLIDTAGVSSPTFTVTKLASDTKYYWRVAGINESLFGAWSDVWNFTTLSLPQVTSLQSPLNGATGVVIKPNLSWRRTLNASSYELQIDTISSFTSPIISKTVLDSVSKIFSGLKTGRTYFWRVRAINEAGIGEWSEVWKFTVEGIIGVQEGTPNVSGIDVEFTNPIELLAQFTITNFSKTHTTVSILDQTGRLVSTVFDGEIPTGTMAVEWDTRMVASGVYFVEVRSSGERVTKKIVTVK
ncbi:MAG: T9SS type A sorting domain-containing protein [Ignavibacteria bacterium]|nr:T9SS type A sorting domain-containing protein [Ignavibacteria bacterium]